MQTVNIAVLKLGNLNLEILELYNFLTKKEFVSFIHQHSFYEVYFVLEGSAKIKADKEVFDISKEEALFMPKNCSHYCLECSSDFRACSFDFNLAYNGAPPVKKVFEYGYFTNLYENAKLTKLKFSKRQRTLLENVLSSVNDFSVYGVHTINAEATNLFLEFSKDIDKKSGESDYGRRFFTANEQVSLRKYRVEYFISSNQTKNCSLNDLADFLHLSVRQTTRFITKTFGKTFKDLLTETRMISAENLIKENKYTLTHIAKRIGYKSYNGFLTAYKNFYGKAPQNIKEHNLK